MIDLNDIEKAIKLGGRDSWSYLKGKMEQGQEFFTPTGVISFVSFLKTEKGGEVPVFRSNVALSSYDYFYRGLICGDVFLSEPELNEHLIDAEIRRLESRFGDKFIVSAIRKKIDLINIELNPKTDFEHTKILSVNDVFIGDNKTVILSTDDI